MAADLCATERNATLCSDLAVRRDESDDFGRSRTAGRLDRYLYPASRRTMFLVDQRHKAVRGVTHGVSSEIDVCGIGYLEGLNRSMAAELKRFEAVTLGRDSKPVGPIRRDYVIGYPLGIVKVYAPRT